MWAKLLHFIKIFCSTYLHYTGLKDLNFLKLVTWLATAFQMALFQHSQVLCLFLLQQDRIVAMLVFMTSAPDYILHVHCYVFLNTFSSFSAFLVKPLFAPNSTTDLPPTSVLKRFFRNIVKCKTHLPTYLPRGFIRRLYFVFSFQIS